jgi:hypothetical protein
VGCVFFIAPSSNWYFQNSEIVHSIIIEISFRTQRRSYPCQNTIFNRFSFTSNHNGWKFYNSILDNSYKPLLPSLFVSSFDCQLFFFCSSYIFLKMKISWANFCFVHSIIYKWLWIYRNLFNVSYFRHK